MTEFIDAERYQGGGKDEVSFRLIVLEHLRHILRLGSKEWRGGHWDTVNSMNAIHRVYLDATHEAYSNAISGLTDILYVHLDKETRETIDAQEADIVKAHEEWLNNDRKITTWYFERVNHKRKIFRTLCVWLGKNGYLETEMYEEG